MCCTISRSPEVPQDVVHRCCRARASVDSVAVRACSVPAPVNDGDLFGLLKYVSVQPRNNNVHTTCSRRESHYTVSICGTMLRSKMLFGLRPHRFRFDSIGLASDRTRAEPGRGSSGGERKCRAYKRGRSRSQIPPETQNIKMVGYSNFVFLGAILTCARLVVSEIDPQDEASLNRVRNTQRRLESRFGCLPVQEFNIGFAAALNQELSAHSTPTPANLPPNCNPQGCYLVSAGSVIVPTFAH